MSRITPSEAMVETLRAEGVHHVTGIVGSAFMDALDLFPAADIRFVPVRHEQAAAHMADGSARATGQASVCIGQNGPGITNMVTGVAAAYHAHSPMVVITPSATTGSVGLDGFQEVEQLSIFRSITKHQIAVPRPDRMAESLRTAFRVAVAELGPVQVDVPRDFFYGDSTEAVLLEPRRYRAENRGPGDSAALAEAASLLAAAERPMIVAGYGVVVSDGGEATARLAERLGAPVANSYLHNDSFPYSHPLGVGPIGYMGSKAAMRLLAEADVVLMLGCRINVFGTVPQYGMDFYPSTAAVIQVDIDPRQIGRSKPVAVGIIGDAGQAARAITARIGDLGPEIDTTGRTRRVHAEKQAWDEELAASSGSDRTPMSPRRALAEIAGALPKGAIVTTDIGNICSVANGYLAFDQPRRFLAAMGFGNCGFAYPAALGAKLARPELPVAAIAGDGAWAMGLQEVMTAVEEDLPVVALVLNNQQWGAEKRNQIDFYGNRFVGTNIGHALGGFDFAAIARAMGAEGVRITDPGDVAGAVVEAFGAGRPTVIEVLVDPDELAEPFRRDALRQPERHLERYRHLAQPPVSVS